VDEDFARVNEWKGMGKMKRCEKARKRGTYVGKRSWAYAAVSHISTGA